MGKYTTSSTEPRPLLVMFNNTHHVSTIMANRSKLSTTKLAIKLQMSRAEREIESLLLRERRKLINSNTPSQHIQNRNNHLVSGQLHAQVYVINNQCNLEYQVQGEIISNAVTNPNPALSQTAPYC